MSNEAATPSVSLPRATLHGYLLCLLGLLFVVENALSGVATGPTLADLGGIVLGGFAVVGGVGHHLRPEYVARGADPAPTALYVAAGIATVCFCFATLSLVS